MLSAPVPLKELMEPVMLLEAVVPLLESGQAVFRTPEGRNGAPRGVFRLRAAAMERAKRRRLRTKTPPPGAWRRLGV